MFIAILALTCTFHQADLNYYCEKNPREWLFKNYIISIKDFPYRYYYKSGKLQWGCELKVLDRQFPLYTQQKCEEIAK